VIAFDTVLVVDVMEVLGDDKKFVRSSCNTRNRPNPLFFSTNDWYTKIF